MLNGYYDFNIRGWKTEPYLTAGLGVAHHSGEMTDTGTSITSVDDSALGFVWNAGAGVKYRTSQDFAWTAGWRYMDGSEVELNDTSIDLSSHEFRIGFEWDLNY